jgi:CVNH domain
MRYLTTFAAVALTMALWTPGTSCAAQTSPSGSYQQSCRDIGVNGSTLYASCKNSNGEWQSTQFQDFQRCAGEIGNNNGTLRCDMRENNFQRVRQGNWQGLQAFKQGSSNPPRSWRCAFLCSIDQHRYVDTRCAGARGLLVHAAAAEGIRSNKNPRPS